MDLTTVRYSRIAWHSYWDGPETGFVEEAGTGETFEFRREIQAVDNPDGVELYRVRRVACASFNELFPNCHRTCGSLTLEEAEPYPEELMQLNETNLLQFAPTVLEKGW